MIKDKPLTGFGYKGFQANYMSNQAQYFGKNPHSRFKQLADNVTQPFNEFIKIAVNYGILGLLLYVLLISIIFWKLLKSKHPQKEHRDFGQTINADKKSAQYLTPRSHQTERTHYLPHL